ncbi:MFS transporter [Glaciihabitans arcticus]|uniref:MFS transporter n=1 Tax=Glaciihabitans arcticus TaxID=2668039 RepID=A0A4Q9GWR2_9MICO|nr:MFS transporter [Glaciihabitans arcticus]TBN57657.1 MFS transporter [Glaciihabitans arcticus]
MSTPPTEPVVVPRRSHFVDLTPFRESPAFFRLWLGTNIANIGGQMTVVAVGLHVFQLTSSTSAVALVGVVGLLPMILAGIYGGLLADSFDRRIVALIAETAAWLSVIGLATLAWLHVDTLWMYYALTTINAVATTIVGTTRSAIVPRLIDARLLPAASALNGIGFGAAIALGPALAGALVSTVGVQWTYTVDAVLFLAAFVGLITLPAILPEGGTQRPGFSAVLQGFTFLRRAPNIRSSFLIDIVAMTFGMPRVIFPAVGALVIGGGAITVAVLTASFAVGAFLSSVFSGRLGQVRWHGRAIRNAVVAYGGFMALFGLVLLPLGSSASGSITDSFASANLPALIFASLALAGAGGADNISAVFRTSMLQSAVPDAMRGRMQGVFIVVVTGGPRVGDAWVGLIAATTLLWLPSLLGGLVIMSLVLLIVAVNRSFREYDALNPLP